MTADSVPLSVRTTWQVPDSDGCLLTVEKSQSRRKTITRCFWPRASTEHKNNTHP